MATSSSLILLQTMYDRVTASNNDVMSGRYHTNPGQDQTHFDCHHMMFFLTNKHRYLGTWDVGYIHGLQTVQFYPCRWNYDDVDDDDDDDDGHVGLFCVLYGCT